MVFGLKGFQVLNLGFSLVVQYLGELKVNL